MILVKIHNQDDGRYDRYVIAPAGIDRETAARIVDAAIEQVRDANPDEYQFEDLEALLVIEGFIFPETISANRVW